MRRLQAMFGVRIVKVVSSFSLILLLAGAVFADDYATLRDKLETATPAQARRVLSDAPISETDTDLSKAVQDLQNPQSQASAITALKRVKSLLDLRVIATRPSASSQADPRSQAVAIKSSPLYRDEGITDDSNWLAKAFERLAKLFQRKPPKLNIAAPAAGGAQALIVIVWILLAALVVTFLVLVLREVSIRKRAKRKAKAMLDDDEPDRTLDEWLTLSDQLTREGRYREAVRALYLSCLLKFDETKVSRFIRGETNWEHLGRINASPKKPQEIDFLPPTKAFDRVWYGHHVRGIEDVDEFKGWYDKITQALAGVRP